MPAEVSPKQIQSAVEQSRKRLRSFAQARLMFVRNYVGPYYDRDRGAIGEEPMNLIFNAVRILVPNIVMSFPVHHVESKYLASREYATLLGMALSQHDKTTRMRDVYRQVLVDAIFMLGILKTGLADSNSVLAFDDNTPHIQANEVYTEPVDFDNFVVDPNTTRHLFRDAQWMGDRIVIPRNILLESGLYRNDLIERLPAMDQGSKKDKTADLSRSHLHYGDASRIQDEVEIIELWVPGANAVLTVPGQADVAFDDYLRVHDYYGPEDGPYTFLALTPPVSGNPLPVSMVGVWNDLHILANRMAKKITDQAERQKDIMTYKRNIADDAQAMLDAKDGESVATDDPDGVKIHSFGGQQQSNEIYLGQVQQWFNMMAGNPQGVGGERFDADSATEARILQTNASVSMEDMKDAVYQMAADEARKRAWYFHTDPFIHVPLIRRIKIPAQFADTSMGPQMVSPAEIQEQQIVLTPEARRGDWLDFTFTVEPESMGRKDSQTRFNEAMTFAVKIMPAAVQTAQGMWILGQPFSVEAYIARLAKHAGIEWLDEVFYDATYQMAMARQMMMGPQIQSSKGQAAMPKMGAGMGAILQNGQPGQVGRVDSPRTIERQEQQSGGNMDQQLLKLGV